MPQFSPGASKTATLTIPVSPAGLNCTAELFLTSDGTTKAVTTGPQAFVSTGSNQSLQLQITMPQTAATYMVRLVILSGGAQIGAYQATDDVIIATPVNPPFTMSLTVVFTGSSGSYQFTNEKGHITNNNSVAITHTLRCMFGWYGHSYDESNPSSYIGALPYYYDGNTELFTVNVTLQPGESIDIVWPPSNLAGTSSWIPGSPVFFRIFDELNNSSPSAYWTG